MQSASIWLIPRKDQEQKLQEIINNLAISHHTSPYVPHITLYHLIEVTSLEKVIAILREKAKKERAFSLDLDKITHSNQFTNTLYAQYAISIPLQKFYENFKKEFLPTQPFELNSHLSLIYKNDMSEKDKLNEIERLRVPQKLILDRLMVITRDGDYITKELDVLEWEIVCSIELPS